MAAALWVALGGALGSVSRYWAGLGLACISRYLPWGTIFINIGGSFLIAFFGALTLKQTGARGVSENIRLFVMVGFCGGFTTFSTFSLQNFELLRQGAAFRAFANMALAVILCLAATALGALWAEKIAAKPQNMALAEKAPHQEKIIRAPQEDET